MQELNAKAFMKSVRSDFNQDGRVDRMRALDGLIPWFNNFTQYSRAVQTREGLADVPQPRAEFAIFGFWKGCEISSIIGGLVIHPIYRIYCIRKLTPETTTNNSYKIIRNKCRRVQGRLLISGMLFGPIVSLIYAAKEVTDQSELKEICYRIRCDEMNMVWDRTSATLGFIGWYWRRFQGAVNGFNFALTYTIFYFQVLKKYTSPLLTDKILPEERYESVSAAENLLESKTPYKYHLNKEPNISPQLKFGSPS